MTMRSTERALGTVKFWLIGFFSWDMGFFSLTLTYLGFSLTSLYPTGQFPKIPQQAHWNMIPKGFQ